MVNPTGHQAVICRNKRFPRRFVREADSRKGNYMKKIASIAVAAFLVAGVSAANAQAGGDNPGGRGVTSTGGANGVTGRNPDGTRAAPVATTRSGVTTGMGMGGNDAELQGNNGNSASGDNSLGHVKGGNIGAGK
jgi:hypothetical protein